MKFDKILDRATSKENLEPDWEAILLCVDALRSGEIQAKPALSMVEKRYHGDNPHSAHHALLVLEALVKNCGPKVHVEVATKETMEDLKHLAASSNEKVKSKILELLQCWAFAFRDRPEYSIVKDTVQIMKLEGFQFPTLREAEAMFDAESAPDWVDSEHCNRCKVAFGLLTRKHHCRNCGQIFCDRCSSRSSIIPKYGIEKEVRVCETCFDKLKGRSKDALAEQSKGVADDSSKASDSAQSAPASKPASTNKDGKTETEIREEEELQLALALSQSEAEEKARKKRGFYSFDIGSSSNPPSTVPVVVTESSHSFYKGAMENSQSLVTKTGTTNGTSSGSNITAGEGDSELARYLNRDYWEQRQKEGGTTSSKPSGGILRSSPTPSAPFADSRDDDDGSKPETVTMIVNGETGGVMVNGVHKEDGMLQNGEVAEMEEFTKALRTNIDVFVNRIRSNQARGRSVFSDTSLQSLFMSLTAQHSELLKHLHELDDRRGHFEGLQDKLQQIKDAREAVDALRLEHSQQRQQELIEQQRIRQIQMVQKLEVMRQQKHEYLEHQRLMAIQRMQQQEQEMLMRKQQQQAVLASMNAPAGGSYAGMASGQWHQNAQQQGMPPVSHGVNVYGMQGMQNALPQQLQQYNPQYDPTQQQQQQFVAQNPGMQQHQPNPQHYMPQQMNQHSGSVDYSSYQAGGSPYQQPYPPPTAGQPAYSLHQQPQQYDPQSISSVQTGPFGAQAGPNHNQSVGTNPNNVPGIGNHFQQQFQQQPQSGVGPPMPNTPVPGSPYQQFQPQPQPPGMVASQQQQHQYGTGVVGSGAGQYTGGQGGYASTAAGMLPQQQPQQTAYSQAPHGGGGAPLSQNQQAIASPVEPLISFD